jgi:FSR family fosmidomycin resistance protein-like MFS transporter
VGATTLIIGVSLALSIAHSPIIALGQSYLPHRLGLASGISLGVVVSVGGAASPLIGLVGDRFGLSASMLVICAIAALASVGSLVVLRHHDTHGEDLAQQPDDELSTGV